MLTGEIPWLRNASFQPGNGANILSSAVHQWRINSMAIKSHGRHAHI